MLARNSGVDVQASLLVRFSSRGSQPPSIGASASSSLLSLWPPCRRWGGWTVSGRRARPTCTGEQLGDTKALVCLLPMGICQGGPRWRGGCDVNTPARRLIAPNARCLVLPLGGCTVQVCGGADYRGERASTVPAARRRHGSLRCLRWAACPFTAEGQSSSCSVLFCAAAMGLSAASGAWGQLRFIFTALAAAWRLTCMNRPPRCACQQREVGLGWAAQSSEF